MPSEETHKEIIFPCTFIIFPPKEPFAEVTASEAEELQKDFPSIELTEVDRTYVLLLQRTFAERLRRSLWGKYETEVQSKMMLQEEIVPFSAWLAALDEKERQEVEEKVRQEQISSKTIKYFLEGGLTSKNRAEYLLLLRETISEQIRHRIWKHYEQGMTPDADGKLSFKPFEEWMGELTDDTIAEEKKQASLEEIGVHHIRYVQHWIENRLAEYGFKSEKHYSCDRKRNFSICTVECTLEVAGLLNELLESAPHIKQSVQIHLPCLNENRSQSIAPEEAVIT